MKSWKEKEKELTEWYSDIGPKAERVSRLFRGERVTDIVWGLFAIEVKTRKKIPKYLHEWMKQAEMNANIEIPVVHWHQDCRRAKDDYVVMYARHFRYLMSLLMALREEGNGSVSQEHAGG